MAVWWLFLRGGGYDDPAEAVRAFVQAVQEGNTGKAKAILHGNGHPMDLLGPAYDEYSEDDLVIEETNVLRNDGERAEVELLYRNEDFGDPTYLFGDLFYLRKSGGWKISDFDGTHTGGRLASR